MCRSVLLVLVLLTGGLSGLWAGSVHAAAEDLADALANTRALAGVFEQRLLDSDDTVIEASRGQRGEIVPSRVMGSHRELAVDDHVEWRDEGNRKALLKVEPGAATSLITELRGSYAYAKVRDDPVGIRIYAGWYGLPVVLNPNAGMVFRVVPQAPAP